MGIAMHRPYLWGAIGSHSSPPVWHPSAQSWLGGRTTRVETGLKGVEPQATDEISAIGLQGKGW